MSIRAIASGGLLFLAIGAFLADISSGLACGNFPTKKNWEANNFEHEGMYSNCRFGFAVSIPDGLIGGVTKPHAPDHGVGIRFQHGVISVEGNHNSIDDWETTEDIVASCVTWITRDAEQVFSTEKQAVTLDGFPATRLIAQVECSDGSRRVYDSFHLLRGIDYDITLWADAANYAEYKPIRGVMARETLVRRILWR